MVNYQDTKIYFIDVKGKRYYGHTAQKYMSVRESRHRTSLRNGSTAKVYKAIREAGLNEKDVKCVWVEDYPCLTVNEAKARERWWIEHHGDLNMYIPLRTYAERRDDNRSEIEAKERKYREENKEFLIERKRIWGQNNKERAAENNKNYVEANKERVVQYRNKYYKEHQERIKERRRKRYAEQRK